MTQHQVTLTNYQLTIIGEAILQINRLDLMCFDGHRHRDMCIDQSPGLYNRLKNRWMPNLEVSKIQLSVSDLQIIVIALQYSNQDHQDAIEAKKILMSLQPKLVHS